VRRGRLAWVTGVLVIAALGCSSGKKPASGAAAHPPTPAVAETTLTTRSLPPGSDPSSTTAGSRPSTSSPPVVPEPPAGEPTLSIRSPHSGETVVPPFAAQYAITGLSVATSPGLHIRVSVAGLPDHTIDLAVSGQSGKVEVPDDKFFSGRRDVTFTLLRSDGTPYANSGASYTIRALTIAGGR
jgi:hypothetical protein